MLTEVRAAADLLDAKPYLPRTTDNPVSLAEQVRDRIADRLKVICSQLGLDALIAASPPYAPDVTVRLEIWRRVNASGVVAGRSHALITIVPKPFHRFAQELKIEYDVCGRHRVVPSLAPLSDEDLRRLVLFVGGWSGASTLKLPRLRVAPLQFHRPKNKVDGIRQDYLPTLIAVAAMLGFFAFAINVASAVLLWVAAAIGVFQLVREPRLVLSSGRPKQEPRSLIRLDSWQTVLRGLGGVTMQFRDRVASEFDSTHPEEATFDSENIWYWGVDGKEERRQFVITFRRAIAFVQIYAYHRDLYVSWDTHVNGGTWSEHAVARGIDKETGLRVVANSIRSAWHVPNEYDVADANYLSEWVHATVVERVKEAMAEHKITQDIDFRILREERRAIVGARDGRVSPRSSVLRTG